MRHSHTTHLHLVLHRLPSLLIDQIFESLRLCSPGMRAGWAQRGNERREVRGRWLRKGEEETGACFVVKPLTTLLVRSTQPSRTTRPSWERSPRRPSARVRLDWLVGTRAFLSPCITSNLGPRNCQRGQQTALNECYQSNIDPVLQYNDMRSLVCHASACGT
jgi:hypothetical protein